MKKIFLFLLYSTAVVLICRNTAFAITHPFSVSSSNSTINATMTGVTDTSEYKLVILRVPFSTFSTRNTADEVTIDPIDSVQKASNGTVSWSISTNLTGTLYLKVFKLTNGTYNAASDAVTNTQILVDGKVETITSSQLTFKTTINVGGYTLTNDGDRILAFGKIDPTANKMFGTDVTKFTAKLYESPVPFKDDTANSEGGKLFESYTNFINGNGVVVGNKPGIDTDGTYVYLITPLTPSTNYYYKQIITAPDGTEKIERGGPFNTTDGIVPTGSSNLLSQQSTDATYHLLAPLPGLTQLMDPTVCAQQKAAGKIAPGAICDINGFLNFMFKTLIGLTAVVLVLRLMYEGYQYMVTDVPFLKASAKSNFWGALFGLLIALSAYLILNTINPQLVNNSITIAQVAVGVEPGNDGLGIETPANKQLTLETSTGPVAVTACNSSEMATITAFGTTFQIQKDLVSSIQRIDAKWRQLNPAYKIPMSVKDATDMGGYNCRNIAGKTKLSYHAYGLAVDINPIENPQGAKLVTDMPQSFVQLWKDEHWGWGGDWTSSKDAMHFSKGINEGGDMKAD